MTQRNVLKAVKLHYTFIISFCLVVFLMGIRFGNGVIQQDNYLGYAYSFSDGLANLSHYDSRLFPGYPILIFSLASLIQNYYIASYLIVISCFILSYVLLFKITRSIEGLPVLIFPPIMLGMATIISTEFISVFLILLSIYLFKKEKYSSVAFISGLQMWFRPVGGVLFVSMILSLFFFSRKKLKFTSFFWFILPIVVLTFYNYYFFNSITPLYQLLTYNVVSPYGNSVGFIQIFKDIVRSFQWKQWNILLSGIFYFSFYIFLIVLTVKKFFRKPDKDSLFLVSSIMLMSIFIFSYTFVPFLENLGRYLVPVFPIIWLLLHKKINNWIIYILLLISILIVI